MGDFNIHLSEVKNKLASQLNIEKNLDHYSERVKDVKNTLQRYISSSSDRIVTERLREIAAQIEKESDSMGAMKDGLEQILNLYQQTEDRIMGEESSGSSNGSNGSHGPGGSGGVQEILEIIRRLIMELLAILGILPSGSANNTSEYAGEPVDMCTGNYVNDIPEITLRGSMDIAFVRHYNSRFLQSGVMGIGWSHNLEYSLSIKKDELLLKKGDGRLERFTISENGIISSVYGGYDTFVRTDDGFCYHEKKSGRDFWFGDDGHILSISDKNGNSIRFTYELGHLINVTGSRERWLRFSYYDNGLLKDVSDSMERRVTYSYIDGMLISAIAADGSVEQYEYDENRRLSAVINAAGVRILENVYDEKGQVIRQVFPDGTVMLYEYDEDSLTFTDRNGAKAIYYHDNRLRHIRTCFENGTESYEYNEKNERIVYTDMNGSKWRRTFDEQGNVISLVDPLGHETKYEFDLWGNLTRVVTPDGEETRMDYDKDGNIISLTDPVGARQEMTYEKGKLATVVNPDGIKTEFSYDDDGHLLTVTDGYGKVVRHEYDKAGRIIKVTNKRGYSSEFEYDSLDRILSIKNPLGQIRRNTYTPTGKLKSVIDFDGTVEKWTYDEMNLVRSYTDKEGKITTFEYDNMSNPVRIIRPGNRVILRTYNNANLLEEEEETGLLPRKFFYDNYGRIIRESRGEERKEYCYDAVGRLVSITDWDGTVTSVERDVMGRIVKRRQADGTEVSFGYDAAGRCISELDPMGYSLLYEYSPSGQMISRTDEGGVRTEYIYDKNGKISHVSYADGNSIDFRYDPEGNLTERKLKSGYTEYYDYDVLNRKIVVSDSDGRTKRLNYDAAGHVVKTIDSEGRTVFYEYTPGGLLKKVTDELGQITHYAYNNAGERRAILKGVADDEQAHEIINDPSAFQTSFNDKIHLITWERNPAGNITEIKNALGSVERFAYDGYGRMIAHTDHRGVELQYKYLPGGLMSEIRGDNGILASFSYDRMKRMTGMQDSYGKSDFVYDSVGHLIHTKDCFGHEIDYYMNAAGKPEKMTVDSMEYLYEYDDKMRLISSDVNGSKVSYNYDGNGRLQGKVLLDGSMESYVYTEAGQLKYLECKDDEGICFRIECRYDERGNIYEKTEFMRNSGERIIRYIYDDLNRIVSVLENGKTIRVYRYDEYSNIIEVEDSGNVTRFHYNVLNQLMKKEQNGMTTAEFLYDAQGSLIHENVEGMIRDYVYDEFSHLKGVTCSNGTHAEYAWDGMGHRLGKKGEDCGQIFYVTDFSKKKENILAIQSSQGTRNFLWDNGLTAEITEDQKFSFYKDERGSVRAVSAGGGLINTGDYDEFGNRIGDTGNNLSFGFTGLLYDSEADSYFAQARSYSPKQRRFLAKDQEQYIFSEIPESVNLYAYCRNNPVIFIDPEGTDCYIFYLPEWENEALADQAALAERYGYDIDKVHIVPVTSAQELSNGWNSMGMENGQPVDIDTVVINSHASPYRLGFGASGNSFSAQDIRNLDEKDPKELVLYGCNAGHLDYQNTNPAAEFARKVNGAQVLASDGTVSLRQNDGDYISRNDDTFRNYLRNGQRDNRGWVQYQYDGNSVHTEPVDRTRMSITEMTNELRRRRGTMC